MKVSAPVPPLRVLASALRCQRHVGAAGGLIDGPKAVASRIAADTKLLTEHCHLGFANRLRSEQCDEKSDKQFQGVEHLPSLNLSHSGLR